MNHYNIFQAILCEFIDFTPKDNNVSLDKGKLNQAIKLVWKESCVLSKWNGQVRPLQSILQRLTSKKNGQPFKYTGNPHFIVPQVLAFDDIAFFTLNDEVPDSESYKTHFTLFIQSLEEATKEEHIYVIAQKYATSVGFTEGVSDVSLFDFVKLVSGAYICLQAGTEVMMVGGDLSGIQEFIYEIVPKTAAKSLKGRSFYIQQIIESAVFQLLNALRLTEVNVVYASGGIYYILAPKTTENIQIVDKLGIELNQQMFNKHRTLLSMQLTYVSITDNKQTNEWDDLKKKLVSLKNQQLKSKLIKDFDVFFLPQEKGGRTQRDAITNEEFDEVEQKEFEQNRRKNNWDSVCYLEYEDDGSPIDPDKTAVKEFTHRLVRLGRRLVETDYWLITDRKITVADIEPFECAIGGVYHYFIKERELVYFPTLPVRRLNQTIGNDNWMLYGGNKFPVYEADQINEKTGKKTHRIGDIKDFSSLALTDNTLQRLAILRMDVDGLGQKFTDGITDKNLVRASTVSRSFDYFIKGYLNHIWEPYADNSYIVYSGGDDLFLLGRWREVLDLSGSIQSAFKEWVGENPAATLSGGLSIVLPKFPVLHSARLAGEAEHESKQHTYKDIDKNAVTLFDIPLNWDVEYQEAQRLKDKFLRHCGGNSPSLNKSILGKISMYYDMKVFQEKYNKNPKWLWTALYDLTRFQQNIHDSEAQEFVKYLKENIVVLKNNYITLAAVAARWAELTMRTTEGV